MTRSARYDGLRLLLITQYYHPEVGAPQTRLRETVAGFQRRGFEVTVVAPIPSYPLGVVSAGYAWWRPTRERLDGASIVRLPTLAIPGSSQAGRLVGHAAFGGASLASLAIARRHDVALVESPPLLLAFTARLLALSGLPYVFHVADPWPDFPIAMGYLRLPVERRLAYAIEDLAYRGASTITTVSPGLVELLSSKPSAAGRVELLPNGVDTDRFVVTDDPSVLRGRLGWDDRFTVAYVGTVGLAQGLATVLEAARMLGPGICIRIVGDGVERQDLEARARDLGLDNVVFAPSVPRPEVPRVLAAADAGLVVLRGGPLYRDSLPTKLLEVMAAARPVIVAADGLAARIVMDADAGQVARADDPADLARAIEACRQDPERRASGDRGRSHVRAHYDRDPILDRSAELLVRAARAR